MAAELRKRGFRPDMTAGLSLGEYAAIAAAGGMSPPDAIRLVRKRGLLMQNTIPAGEGAMCAVLGMETAVIETVLFGVDGVTIANYNCPGQLVITGRTAAVETAAEKLKFSIQTATSLRRGQTCGSLEGQRTFPFPTFGKRGREAVRGACQSRIP